MAFALNNHVLKGDGVKHVQTQKMGGQLNPQFLLIHYTAGASYQTDVDTLSVSQTQASVHLVISRKGEITQIVPFNRVAWHAGESSFGNLSGMNKYSLGIELCNAGLLRKDAAGTFKTWWGASIPAAEVYEAAHERGGPVVGWHMYTKAQIDTLLSVAEYLHSQYNFIDVLGHDDVSWPRKTDPGPAFPMTSIRSRLLGRA